MTWKELQAAGADMVHRHGPAALRSVISYVEAGWPREAILRAIPSAISVLAALDAVDRPVGLAYLSGVAAGFAQRADEVNVQTVWSGPSSHGVPVRATAAVLANVIREARSELLLMTYSARQHQPVLDALRIAVGRGVSVRVVIETLQAAGSALNGEEPYLAFAGVPQAELWHWPTAKRSDPGAKYMPS